MTPDLGIKPGTHWWEASTLTTVLSLLPLIKILQTLNLKIIITFFSIIVFMIIVFFQRFLIDKKNEM